MSKLSQFTVAATLTAGLACSLAAQIVSGVVALPSDAPAAGVIIAAIDEHGATVAKALANSRGAFVLRLPSGGRFGLQLLRIGYRPTQLQPVTVAAGETVTTRLVFVAEPVTLAAVSVNASETCRVGVDTGLAIAHAWQEARKAMLSTQLNADSAPLVAEWIEPGGADDCGSC